MAGLGFLYLGIYALQVAGKFDPQIDYYLNVASWTIWGIFAGDLAIKIFHRQKLSQFFKQNWLEILTLAVPFLRMFRVLRVLVAVRGLKAFMANRMAATGTYIVVLLPLTWFTSAVAVLDAEANVSSSHITNFPDALWWSLATITTVGYGDLYPITAEGKFVAAMLMLLGIGLFSACAGILASWIMSEKKK
jgi:voltage-gated potassium channel